MNDTIERSQTHATFVIERAYPEPAETVWHALSDNDARDQWFGAGEAFDVQEKSHEFRVGGHGTEEGQWHGGPRSRFESTYTDIVDLQRIVFTYDMWSTGGTVRPHHDRPGADGDQTRLTYTEQAVHFDGLTASRAAGRGQPGTARPARLLSLRRSLIFRCFPGSLDPSALRPSRGRRARRSSTPVWTSIAKRSGTPVLHQAAVDDPGDASHGEVDRAVARRPEEQARRRPTSPHPDPDGGALLDRVLDREADVGHGPVNVGDRVLEVLDRLGSGAGQAELVVHEAGRADLVGHGAVSGGEALIEDPLHHGVGRGLAPAHDRRAGRGHSILPGGQAHEPAGN
jgi:uncharacterized protein YndB with AHSA1/START domain